jgi:hypothetical protein
MLKRAYELGIETACAEVGITKEAFGTMLTKGLSMLGSKVPHGAKVLDWGMKHPLAAKMVAGAGIGGLGGAAFGDEGGLARGALLGAGVGAGAHAGKMYGLGRGGRAADRLLRRAWQGAAKGSSPTGRVALAQNRRIALAQKILGQRGGRALGYGLGGAAAGGVGGALAGNAMIPEVPEVPEPWYK